MIKVFLVGNGHIPVKVSVSDLQLVDVVLGRHCVVAEVGHHLGSAARAKADRRRVVGAGNRSKGHVGGETEAGEECQVLPPRRENFSFSYWVMRSGGTRGGGGESSPVFFEALRLLRSEIILKSRSSLQSFSEQSGGGELGSTSDSKEAWLPKKATEEPMPEPFLDRSLTIHGC